MRDCGGCLGIGAHKKFCPAVHGTHASVRYRWSQRAENLADEIGSNDVEAANTLYVLAGTFHTEAVQYSEAYRAAQG